MIYVFIGIAVVIVALSIVSYLLANQKIKKHGTTVSKVVLTLVLVLTTILSFFAIKAYSERPIKPAEVIEQAREVLSKEYPDKVYNATGSETEEFTKQSAIDTLTKLLNEIVDKDNEMSMKDRYDTIVKDNAKYKELVSQDVLDRYYQIDNLNTDETSMNMSLSLLSISSSLIDENKDIAVKAVNIENVYLSKETNTVRIPLDIYTNKYSGYTIDMVFIDGHWYIDSYSLMNQVNLVSYLQEIFKSNNK